MRFLVPLSITAAILGVAALRPAEARRVGGVSGGRGFASFATHAYAAPPGNGHGNRAGELVLVKRMVHQKVAGKWGAADQAAGHSVRDRPPGRVTGWPGYDTNSPSRSRRHPHSPR